jgi:exopolysaccharide biosynthesis polyprenyl glycosylphosphotransferase
MPVLSKSRYNSRNPIIKIYFPESNPWDDMFRRFSTNFAIFSICIDGLIVILSLAVADYLRPTMSSLPIARDVFEQSVPLQIYPIIAIIWIFIFLLLSIYDGRRNLYVVDELTNLTLGSILAGISIAGLLYLSYRDISRLLFMVFVLSAYLLMVIWRIIARIGFRFNLGKPSSKNVLVVGAGPVGNQIQDHVDQHPYLGLNVIGYLDDDPNKKVTNNVILGTLSEIMKIIASHEVDDIVIALPRRAHEQVSELVVQLHNIPVKIWVIPDYFHLALHKATVLEFAGLPMLDLRAPALNEYQRMTKRAFDLIVGIALLILMSPIMLIVAITIKLDSPGPIIYKSKRIGENGSLFEMLKFRSMVKNADQLPIDKQLRDLHGNLTIKIPDDPRVTRVGKFIRRTSLDELPQLVNVLKGEMSLIGPRPELPALVKHYEPWQRKRFAVPQGITGWWQINGRSDKPMHLHTEDDIYYVQNYSLLLDLTILVKTVWVVLRGKGAY